MTPEIGSLRALATGESQFVGSSSGVYFINTVKRVFSTADGQAINKSRHIKGSSAHDDPSPEDCIVGGANGSGSTAFGETSGQEYDRKSSTPLTQSSNHDESLLWEGKDCMDDMSNIPVYSVARELVLTYFRIWHPLVPFLQGREILANLDSLYRSTTYPETESMVSTSLLFTFRCVFNIARLEKDTSLDLGFTAIRSPSDLLPTLSHLALRCDTASIQAMLCAQVYFISTMSLRHASSVGGLISKSIFQSGMHRCPTRYEHLSPDERSMRKRIFWSFYVLDRFVSQSLGHPSGIQDSDIDVCSPGHVELHEPVMRLDLISPESEGSSVLHLPSNHPNRLVTSPSRQIHSRGSSPEAEEEDRDLNKATGTRLGGVSSRSAMIHRQRRETQAVLEHHVRHSQLVGRILEVFHKSIHARQLDNQTVLHLKADVSAFGNDLNQPRFGPTIPEIPSLTPDPTVFPFVSYHYAVLLLNRPSLSLNPKRGEFREALQTCIGAANTVLHTIRRYVGCGGPLFWPGYMSAVWMSGLVLALAIRLELCNKPKAKSTAHMAVDLLVAMSSRWAAARHCEQVLSSLLQSIEAGAKGHEKSRPDTNAVGDAPTTNRGDIFCHDSEPQDAIQSPSKRRRTNAYQSSSRNQENRPMFSQASEALQASWVDPVRSNQNQCPEPSQPAMSPALNAYGDATSVDAVFAPIPTICPDQQKIASSQYLDQVNGIENLFDMFDEATWGSLLDIANGAGTVTN
ncbi:putative Zn(II)2Cys6 transcription factor [Colletotrichum eremochloae]|nr:putative Zn(II)2Cys6 transcription factor [Colletotrichum eremochloae]